MTPATFSIPFSSIIEGDRARNKDKYGDITELANSLREHGTIQPIVLSKRLALHNEIGVADFDGYVYDLIAGGRRYKAMQFLGETMLWHASTLNPAKLGFIFADEVPEDVRRAAELEENLRRLSMDWIDETLTIADLHAAKTRAKVRWTQADTARICGLDSHFMVSIHCSAAKLLRAGDAEVLACKDISSVIGLIARRREEEALKVLEGRVAEKFRQSGQTVRIEVDEEGISSPVIVDESTPTPLPPPSIPLSSMFTVGDSIEKMRSLPDGSFNHIITDIPYGIDMDNLEAENVAITAAEHDVQTNIELMAPFLFEAFRLLKPHGFCCFFFDLDYLNPLQVWAKEVGFKVQRWPIIIHKTSPCRNTCAQYNTTKNYEALLYLRRDEHTVLRRAVSSSVRSYDFLLERSLYAHPFYKPSAAWSDIYSDVAFTGQSVFDPFCGECSGAAAAVAKGLVPYGNDLVEGHVLRGIQHVKAAYSKLLGNPIFT
jgi:DNA modification methylase